VTVEATIVSGSPEATEAAGERLAQTLGPGDVVGLTGDLGAGKTCFIQGLVRGLGVKGHATSPTFVLINEYQARLPIRHVDAYRTESLTQLLDLGLPERFDEPGVTVIEWADKVGPLLPSRTVHVHIAGVGDEPREITIRRA
jgi:tRNA threonylcarbamoyladenosine biosynthesis protein TsaE